MSKALALFHQHKSKLYLMKISALQVIVSFLTNILILRSIGLGGDLDVFYIGMSLFAFLYTSINWSLSSILAPYLIDNRGDGKEGALFVTVSVMVIPIALLVGLTMPLWVKYLYINYLDTVDYSKIMLVQGILIAAYIVDGFTLVYIAMLQEKNKYITFNMSMLTASIVGLIFVWFTLDTLGVYAAAVNQLLMKLVILSIMSYMFLPHVIKTIAFNKEQLNYIYHRTKYILMGSLYYRTDELAERYIASYLTGGFVSLLSFVQRVYGAIITVLNSAIGLPAVTVFGNLIAEKKHKECRQVLLQYIFYLVIINSLLFTVVILFGEWLFLFIMKDELTVELNSIIYTVILCLFSAVFTRTITQVSHSLLLALNKGSIATAYDSSAFTINLILKIALTIHYGINGLLMAMILSVLITDGAKMFLAFRELKKLGEK